MEEIAMGLKIKKENNIICVAIVYIPKFMESAFKLFDNWNDEEMHSNLVKNHIDFKILLGKYNKIDLPSVIEMIRAGINECFLIAKHANIVGNFDFENIKKSDGISVNIATRLSSYALKLI